MKNIRLLIVDDEQAQRDSLSGYYNKRMKVYSAGSLDHAKNIISKESVDIILSDYKMPDGTGVDLLKYAKSVDDSIVVIIMTAYGTIETAVEAMKSGACNYIQKPLNLDELDVILNHAVEQFHLSRENAVLRESLKDSFYFPEIITQNAKMKEIMSIVSRIASSETTVLIQGESGTGKELIAKALHAAGDRKDEPFIAFNVVSFSENLIESELFGHEKGSFTGADKQKIGRFEQADGGTIFIDEIGDISPNIQVKLLRVLQERIIERVGGIKSIPVDVRVITATHQNLTELIKNGEFREDLFYRINVVNITLPVLSERKEDIRILTDHFIKKYSKKNHKNIRDITRDALSLLMRYDFPGNIRELENIIERAVLLCRSDTIKESDIALPASYDTAGISSVDSGYTLQESVENLEKGMIKAALSASKGNQSEAARQLNINEKTLRYKLKKYNLK